MPPVKKTVGGGPMFQLAGIRTLNSLPPSNSP
jgi:hypothetical protein